MEKAPQAILILGSLVGKVARTSVSLAVEDFYTVNRNYSTKLVLHIRDSMGSDVQAASAAIELLENYKVQAIIGPQKSSEAVFISNLGNMAQVPTVSFTATSPSLIADSMPYFVRATLSDSDQVNSIASLIQALPFAARLAAPDGSSLRRDSGWASPSAPHADDSLARCGGRRAKADTSSTIAE